MTCGTGCLLSFVAMKSVFLPMAGLACLTTLQAQTPVTISTGPSNADQVWYSLLNGEAARAALAEWDLAFELTGLTTGIRVNTAKGLEVYETPATFDGWDDLASPDPDAWTQIQNDVTRWDLGALNHGNNMEEGGFNLGWGMYNVGDHHMNGNKVYAISFPDGTWKKLRIDSLVSGVWNLTYADLDGSNSHDGIVDKAQFPGKNFAYWSFGANASLDREPASADWDLLFTKYVELLDDEGTTVPYAVAGVLQNRLVSAMKVEDVPTDEAEWSPGDMRSEINVVGYDWKNYDFAMGMYMVAPDRTYFVKDRPGNIWKIIFTGYGGGTTGEMSFTQEMVSATGVQEHEASRRGAIIVHPNPVSDGQARLVLDLPAGDATLKVFNGAGVQVLEETLRGTPGLSAHTLDVGALAPGLYVLRASSAQAAATAKLVVE